MKGVIIIKKLFDDQDLLLDFPIPPLESTHHKLLEWIEPLVDDEQFQQTTYTVNRFFAKNGHAEKIQAKLEELKKQTKGNWLTPFWNDHYLTYRGALPTGMHFNILVDRPLLKEVPTTAELAGKISFLIAEYYHKIIDGEVEPVTVKGLPLDMSQYKKFFCSMRIPGQGRDQFIVAPFNKRNNFIILIYRNHMYKVPVTNEKGHIYSSHSICTAIESIFTNEQEDGLNIGIFTTTERDQAATIYQHLEKSEINATNLQLLSDSLLVISIDEDSDNSEEAIENLMLNSKSKYYDKTIQLSITKKGRLGYSIEHTAVDGTTIFSVISYVNERMTDEFTETKYTDEQPSATKLDWFISEKMKTTLLQLETENEQRRNEYSIQSKSLEEFGSDMIKKLKLSPDAFFHIALQIAQYRTFGQLKSVYEPVSMRHYYGGRTECARATSMEKTAVIQAIEQGKSNEVIYEKMVQASDAHAKRIADCRNGFGIERHLFGLEKVFYQYGESLGIDQLPDIFSDVGYRSLREDFISTSGMVYDNVRSRIFGPVVKGGFGLAYILLNHSISINISCQISEQQQAKQLASHLVDACKELKAIAEQVVQTKKASDRKGFLESESFHR